MAPPRAELRTRRADRRDAAALADIKRAIEDRTYASFGTPEEHRRSLREFCSTEYVAGLIDDPATTVFVAEHGHVPVGLAALTEKPAFGLVHAVYAARRGEGIGLALVAAVAAQARGRRARLCCEIFAANAPALRFFSALGFEPQGERLSDSYRSQRLLVLCAPVAEVSRQARRRLARRERLAASTPPE